MPYFLRKFFAINMTIDIQHFDLFISLLMTSWLNILHIKFMDCFCDDEFNLQIRELLIIMIITIDVLICLDYDYDQELGYP